MHDLLVPVVTGEVEVEMTPESCRHLHAYLDAMCWVLDHDHNDAFRQNLVALENTVALCYGPLKEVEVPL